LGEIDYLTRLVSPDIALIIMAGTAHIGELGSREAIAEAKGEIFAGLSSSGIAVVNMDDRFGSYWQEQAGSRRAVSFGAAVSNDVVGEFSAQSLVIRYAGESVEAHLHVAGEHNQHNALAAAATAIALNIPRRFRGCGGSLANLRRP
jgi:UDP-N-acetylmuramoyl-tripeptide--D-alanyl-D-alanine ligase